MQLAIQILQQAFAGNEESGFPRNNFLPSDRAGDRQKTYRSARLYGRRQPGIRSGGVSKHGSADKSRRWQLQPLQQLTSTQSEVRISIFTHAQELSPSSPHGGIPMNRNFLILQMY